MLELESGENKLWWFNTGKKNLFRRLLIPAPDETTAQAWADEICGKGQASKVQELSKEELFGLDDGRDRADLTASTWPL